MPKTTYSTDDQSKIDLGAEKRRKIAVFLNEMSNSYQYAICEGIVRRAGELGFSVLIFTSDIRHIVNEDNEGELKLFQLPDLRGFDGIIVATNTITCTKTLEYLRNSLPTNDIPVVSLGPPIGDSYSIDSADNGCLETLIRHFILEHRFTRINFISGTPGNPDAEYRLNTYKRVLEKYGIEYNDDRVFIGDFSRECAREAIAQFLQAGIDLPQAIVCANDNMALGAYAELTRRGLRVPEDIALSGYDCIHDAEHHSPRITTVRQSLFDMSIRAVNIINNVIAGAHIVKEYKFGSQVIIAGSCGCTDKAPMDDKQLVKEFELNTDESGINNNISTSMMELLTGAYTMQDIVNQLASLSRVLDFKHLYLCIDEDSLVNDTQVIDGYPEEMTLMLGMVNGTLHSGLKFKTREVLPTLDSNATALVLSSLYYKRNTFGYIAYDFTNSSKSMQCIWVKNVRLAFENLRTQEVLRQYSIALEELSIHDPLTGVLNRRGLEKHVKSLLSTDAQGMLFVIFVDLDSLKYINDTYGHASGDEAIQVVADILKRCSRSDDIIARMGGDEFVCVGRVTKKESLRSILFSMQSNEKLHNEHSGKLYAVNASYGWYLQQGKNGLSIMQMIDKADSHLYEQKRLRYKR